MLGQTAGVAAMARNRAVTLEQLWPAPSRWADLIEIHGAHRAALAMVTHGNLAKDSHPDGWLGISGALWSRAYRFAVPAIRQVLAMPGPPVMASITREYNHRMTAFESEYPAELLANQWSYAIGRIASLDMKHPFHFTPGDELRWKYLPVWGWGEDPNITDYLAMGALCLENPVTGEARWKAVRAIAGKWSYVDTRDFATEREALERVAVKVAQSIGVVNINPRMGCHT